VIWPGSLPGSLPAWAADVAAPADAARAVAEGAKAAAEGIDEIAWDLVRAAGPGNVVVSPASVWEALAMTHQGARGETAAEIAGVLGMPDERAAIAIAAEGLRASLAEARGRAITLDVANRLWVQRGKALEGEFTATLARRFGAGAGEVDFSGAAEAARGETAAKRAAAPGWNRAKSVVLVYLQGGPSHIDLWDPKENVPDNVRSTFKSIPTKLPGVQFTENLPKLAGINDRFTLIRSMNYTPNGLFNHTAAIYQMMTGYTTDKVSPSGQLEPPNAKDYPNFGSNIIRLKPMDEPMLPFVMLPRPLQDPRPRVGGAGCNTST
jgi:hypothetical protein